MTLRLATAICGLIVGVAGSVSAAPQAHPVASVSLDEVVPAASRDASSVFLTDDSIGLLIRTGHTGAGSSRLVILRLTGGKLQVVASAEKANGGDDIYAASGGRLVVAARRHAWLYSSDLREVSEIPVPMLLMLRSFFPRSGIFGEGGPDKPWSVFHVSGAMTAIREGPGELLSVSDETVVFRVTIRFASRHMTDGCSG